MSSAPVRRILIIKLRAIGDVIMATPVIENLRAAYPDAEIDFLTERPCYPIVKNHPDLNEVIVFNRSHISNLPWHAGLRENLKFIKRLRANRYDLVFDLFGNPRSALLALATGAPVRVGFEFRGRKYAYNKVISRAAIKSTKCCSISTPSADWDCRSKQPGFIMKSMISAQRLPNRFGRRIESSAKPWSASMHPEAGTPNAGR